MQNSSNNKLMEAWHTLLVVLLALVVLSFGIQAKAESVDLCLGSNKQEISAAIYKASSKYKVDAKYLLQIAFVESSLNVSVKPQYNTNGTRDIGVFQINTIHVRNKCKNYNIETLQGNALCAASLVAMHSSKAASDIQWLARYHSKTPSIKARYYAKIVKAQVYLLSKGYLCNKGLNISNK